MIELNEKQKIMMSMLYQDIHALQYSIKYDVMKDVREISVAVDEEIKTEREKQTKQIKEFIKSVCQRHPSV